MKFLAELIELIFPSRCLLCRAEAKDVLCFKCLSQIRRINIDFEKCLMRQDGFLDGIFSAAFYESTLRKAIHLFKYKNEKKLAVPLGDLLVDFYKMNIALRIDAVVPVPVFQRKFKARGYNHSCILASILAEKLNLKLEDKILFKVKDTLPQNKLNSSARFENVKGSFSADFAGKSYKSILLIDDIITTGATSHEAAKILKESSADKVYLLTLATTKERDSNYAGSNFSGWGRNKA